MITRHEVTGRLSKVVVANGFAFLSGLTPNDRSGGVAEQTADILRQIDALLAEAGTDKTKLLMVNIWLSDMSTFAEMNAVWDKWVVAGATPGRATVEAKLAAPQFTVEIAVIAAK